jgi:hypothetical protein
MWAVAIAHGDTTSLRYFSFCGTLPGNRLQDKSRLSGVISCARLKEGTAVSVNSFTVDIHLSTAKTRTVVNEFDDVKQIEKLRAELQVCAPKMPFLGASGRIEHAQAWLYPRGPGPPFTYSN